MPQIKEYGQQTDAGNSFNTFQANSDAANITGRQQMQAGDNLAQAGNNIANAIDKVQISKELSAAHADLTQLQADQTNELKSQSELGSFNMDDFQKSYDEKVAKISEKYNRRQTQEFIQENSANAKAHFTTEGFAIAQELSATQFQADAKASKANYSVMVNTNPDALNTAIEGYSNFLDKYASEHANSVDSKRIEKAVIKEKQSFRSSLALDALKGVADIDPDKAQELLDNNFLAHYGGDTELKDKATAYVHEQVRAQELDATRTARLEEKAQKAKEEKTYNDVISGILNDDPNITAQSIAKLDMSGELKKSAYNFMAVDNKKEASAAANERFSEFADRARLPDGDPNKIYGISDLGKLSEKEFPLKLRLQLTKIIEMQDSPEGKEMKKAEDKFLQFAKDRIAGKDELGKMKDPNGYAKYAEFYNDYIKQRTDLRKQGIPVSELFKDPTSSKSSLYPLVDQYTSSFQEKINANIQNMNKNAAPRPINPVTKAPMSAADILKNATQKAAPPTTQAPPPTTPPPAPTTPGASQMGPKQPAASPEPEAWNVDTIPDSPSSDTVKNMEGFRDKAYKDDAGVWTIGYGTTKGVKEGDTITEPEAAKRMKEHLGADAKLVDKAVTRVLTEKQVTAIHSLVYNIGFDKFKDSTLLKKLNDPQADVKEIADEFLKWNKIGDKVDEGLTKRREKERELFLAGYDRKNKKVG